MSEQTEMNRDAAFQDAALSGEIRMMISKTKAVLVGLALAGFVFMSLGVNGVAQAAEGLTPAMEAQIQAQIQALIIDSGDTAISEQALSDMVAANPGVAKDIADFATRPANLPNDLSADAVENLVIAVARAAASGAPEMAADVMDVLAANQPAYIDGVTTAVEGALIVLAAAGTPAEGGAADDDSIGIAGVVEGTVTATRVDGTKVTLAVDSPIYVGDVMETGRDSALGLVFIDGTTFSIGADAEMVIDDMVYDPESETGIMQLSMITGAFAFVTGAIAPSGPDAMTITNQVSTIGIRGTSGAGDNNRVFLLLEADGSIGEIYVSNRKTGKVVRLNKSNYLNNSVVFKSATIVTFTLAQQQTVFGNVLSTSKKTEEVKKTITDAALKKDDNKDETDDKDKDKDEDEDIIKDEVEIKSDEDNEQEITDAEIAALSLIMTAAGGEDDGLDVDVTVTVSRDASRVTTTTVSVSLTAENPNTDVASPVTIVNVSSTSKNP